MRIAATRFCLILVCLLVVVCDQVGAAESRFASSQSDARYLHWIHLYDADNRRITAESDRPYSSKQTCGRCHDYDTISHGWHFNAFDPQSLAGRGGEPWIWTDPRTGTQLPLSYRDWAGTFRPDELGLSAWEMTRKFGGRLPGGGLGMAPEIAEPPESRDADAGSGGADGDAQDAANSRWALSGSLEIDCMVCHATSGAYDFNLRREQIEEENFAWAATAALRLAEIDGRVSRIKDDADPADEATQEKLPKVVYDAGRFSADGTVFMDLVRKPESNACYQCHSNRVVGDGGLEMNWVHDQDVHLRAGMACADCHRNGIDHHIVRGFEGEQNPSGRSVTTLSCAGCHLGEHHNEHDGEVASEIESRAGRLGAPKPLHEGLPPLHFEKLSCTACHGGPVPRDEAVRVMTSLAHGLGKKEHWTGGELPAILGPVYRQGEDGRVVPNRVMWPSFWGVVSEGRVTPLSPEKVYDITRRSLRVRKDFVDELLKPKMRSSELKELVGEERYRLEDEWTDEEREKVDARQAELGREEFNEKVYKALEAIEEEEDAEQAVFVSSGVVYARDAENETLQPIELESADATQMVHWPMAHNVRPSGWSLGVKGCTECHSDQGKIFVSTVAATGPGPDDGEATTMAALQGVPEDQRLAWNELFKGRKNFKLLVGGSIAVLLMTLMIGVGAFASRVGNRKQLASTEG